MRKMKYKPNTTIENVRFNMEEMERRCDAYAEKVADWPEYQHEGYGYYLSDGVSVSPQTHAVMIGAVEFPCNCECGKCAECRLYEQFEEETIAGEY